MKEETVYINGVRVVKVTAEVMDAFNFYALAQESRKRIEESQSKGNKLTEKQKQDIINKFDEDFGSKYIISKQEKDGQNTKQSQRVEKRD